MEGPLRLFQRGRTRVLAAIGVVVVLVVAVIGISAVVLPSRAFAASSTLGPG